MKRNSIVGLSLTMFLTLAVSAQEKQPLKLIKTTPLPGFTGDFDHFAIDLQGKRLFLTAEDHKSVEVFDLSMAIAFTASRDLVNPMPRSSCPRSTSSSLPTGRFRHG